MDKEDIDKLLNVAAKSRIHSALIGALLLVVGLIFAIMGAHAIVLEITVTGILMIVVGIHTVTVQGIKSLRGIPLIILGALFVIFVFIFEKLHGILLCLEFLSTGILSLAAALGYRESKRGRRTSLLIGVVALYVGVNLVVAHEESLDILITIMGVLLVGLSAYVLLCAGLNRPVVNPFSKAED